MNECGSYGWVEYLNSSLILLKRWELTCYANKKKRVPTLRFSHPAYHTLLVLAILQIAPVALFIELVIFKLRTETPFWDFFLLINSSTLCAIVVNIDVCPTSYHTSTNQPKKKNKKHYVVSINSFDSQRTQIIFSMPKWRILIQTLFASQIILNCV